MQKYTFSLFLLAAILTAPFASAQTVQSTLADVPLNTLPAPYVAVSGAAAPITQSLSGNGVTWTVYNTGPANPADLAVDSATGMSSGWSPSDYTGNTGEFYLYRGTNGVQVWLFSTPVNLSFVLQGFNSYNTATSPPQGEGITFPPGTVCTVPSTPLEDPINYSGVGPIDPSANITVAPTASGTTVQLTDGGNLSSAEISLLGEASIFCTLSNVTQLTLNGSGTPSTGIPFWNNKADGLNALTATPAAMTATFSGLPSSLQPGQTAQGTLTCQNTGVGPDVDNATCIPSDATGGAISNVQCTPATPAATLEQNQSIVCTFDVTAPGTGPVNLQLTGTAGSDEIDTATTAQDNPTDVPTNPTLEPAPTVWATAQFLIGPMPVPAPILDEKMLALLVLLMVGGGAMIAMRRDSARR